MISIAVAQSSLVPRRRLRRPSPCVGVVAGLPRAARAHQHARCRAQRQPRRWVARGQAPRRSRRGPAPTSAAGAAAAAAAEQGAGLPLQQLRGSPPSAPGGRGELASGGGLCRAAPHDSASERLHGATCSLSYRTVARAGAAGASSAGVGAGLGLGRAAAALAPGAGARRVAALARRGARAAGQGDAHPARPPGARQHPPGDRAATAGWILAGWGTARHTRRCVSCARRLRGWARAGCGRWRRRRCCRLCGSSSSGTSQRRRRRRRR